MNTKRQLLNILSWMVGFIVILLLVVLSHSIFGG